MKNAILIVEFANQLREQGVDTATAVQARRAKRGLRPILMTSLAFMLGVMPLVFATGAGSGARHSLGTAVFGGMILSTFLNLFIIPVLYVFIAGIEDRFGRGRHEPRRRGHGRRCRRFSSRFGCSALRSLPLRCFRPGCANREPRAASSLPSRWDHGLTLAQSLGTRRLVGRGACGDSRRVTRVWSAGGDAYCASMRCALKWEAFSAIVRA